LSLNEVERNEPISLYNDIDYCSSIKQEEDEEEEDNNDDYEDD
jgi:hypothetical protein